MQVVQIMASESGGQETTECYKQPLDHCHSVRAGYFEKSFRRPGDAPSLYSLLSILPLGLTFFRYKISNLALIYRLVRSTHYQGRTLVSEILREAILHPTFPAARIAMRTREPLASMRLSKERLPTRVALPLSGFLHYS